MANMYDEMYDNFYATTCGVCRENEVDEFEEKCGYCMLEEFATMHNEDIALEMSLGLDY